MKFGLGFGQDQNVHNVAEYARKAEALGYDHLTFADINNLAHEVHVMMTLAGMATEKILIGHGVTNPATYHPGAIANAMATLRELTGDRAFVGIGAGGPYGQLLHRGVKMKQLRDAVHFIRAYSSGADGELADGEWHSEWIRNSRYKGRHVPQWVAVAGPRTCEISGEAGDAVLSIGMDPVLQGWRRDQVARGSASAGRDPKSVAFYVRTQCYITESKAAAKRELEPYAATCTWELYQILKRKNEHTVDLAERIEARHPDILEEFERICATYDPYWTERIGGPQTEFVSQRVIDFFLASGTAEDISAQIEALRPMGIDGLSMVMFSIEDDFGMMETLARDVMPRFV